MCQKEREINPLRINPPAKREEINLTQFTKKIGHKFLSSYYYKVYRLRKATVRCISGYMMMSSPMKGTSLR